MKNILFVILFSLLGGCASQQTDNNMKDKTPQSKLNSLNSQITHIKHMIMAAEARLSHHQTSHSQGMIMGIKSEIMTYQSQLSMLETRQHSLRAQLALQ